MGYGTPPLLFIVLIFQFLDALILLGLSGFALIVSLAMRCFFACKSHFIVIAVLVRFLTLVLICNEMSHAREETLSVNRFLYRELA
ncbi:hypothetical protein F5882DRAFT_422513 [Hyaloscypha sp. PMI_1271]|nr:hypothetical protein F5882DRAFT_422513 [Hyaloscypha sp. PMI_1271]